MVLVVDVDELMARSQQLVASSFLEKIKFGVTFPGNTQHQLPHIIPGMLVNWVILTPFSTTIWPHHDGFISGVVVYLSGISSAAVRLIKKSFSLYYTTCAEPCRTGCMGHE